MIIAGDKNQFSGSHGQSNARKHEQIIGLGHELIQIPISFGDYCLVTDQMQETIKRRGNKLKKQDLIADIKFSIDTKKNLDEVAMNICGKTHERFRDESILAQKMNARFVVLIEEEGITDIQQVFKWQNPRMHRYNKIKYMHNLGKWQNVSLPKVPPVKGETLAKAMLTMALKYNIEWQFVKPREAGHRIVTLLEEMQ